MNLAIAVFAGLLVAVAAGCVRQAVRAPTPTPRRQALAGVGSREAKRLAVAIGCAVVVLLLSGWLVAAVAVFVLVWLRDRIFTANAARAERSRLEGIKKWLEDLRDVLKPGSMSLEQALEQTARTAPTVIADDLARFDLRRRQGTPTETALVDLAGDLGHPLGDAAVAALVFAIGSTGGSLHRTLEQLAVTARDELEARERIDRVRVGFERSMRRMLMIVAVLIVYLRLAAGDTLSPYRDPAGQAWLLIPIGVWAVALWWLRRLSRYEQPARYLLRLTGADRSLV